MTKIENRKEIISKNQNQFRYSKNCKKYLSKSTTFLATNYRSQSFKVFDQQFIKKFEEFKGIQ